MFLKDKYDKKNKEFLFNIGSACKYLEVLFICDRI
jgi:hypothetical protein